MKKIIFIVLLISSIAAVASNVKHSDAWKGQKEWEAKCAPKVLYKFLGNTGEADYVLNDLVKIDCGTADGDDDTGMMALTCYAYAKDGFEVRETCYFNVRD